MDMCMDMYIAMYIHVQYMHTCMHVHVLFCADLRIPRE